jgi:hypothetical protein
MLVRAGKYVKMREQLAKRMQRRGAPNRVHGKPAARRQATVRNLTDARRQLQLHRTITSIRFRPTLDRGTLHAEDSDCHFGSGNCACACRG